MENGVNKVEQVMSKVEDFDKGIGSDDGFEESNCGVESVSKTVDVEVIVDGKKDGLDENGDGLGVNAGHEVDEKVEDLYETPRAKVSHIDPVKEVISMKVILF